MAKEKKAAVTEVRLGGVDMGSKYSCAYSPVGKKKKEKSKSVMCVSFLQRVLESCRGGGD